jgi:Flp pilus assembly protein TadG
MMRRVHPSFARDRRGVAAVEFALVAPFMVFCYLGVSILASALLVQRRAEHVASSVADLVAQQATTSPGELTDICTVSNTIMQPYSTTSTALQLRVSSIQEDAGGNLTVGWSYNCQGTTALTKGSAYTGPVSPYISASQSIIVAEATYVYISPLGTTNISWLPGSYTFTNKFYLQPRESQNVTCATCT